MVKIDTTGTKRFLSRKLLRNLFIFIIFIISAISIILITFKHNANYLKIELVNKEQYFQIVPDDINIRSKSGDEFVITKSDSKKIYKYNYKVKSTKYIGSVYNRNNYIKTLVSNNNYIVWVEDERTYNTNDNITCEWQIISKNLLTGEEKIIDSNKIIINREKIPNIVKNTPDQIAISEQDELVYCRITAKESIVTSELIYYNLQKDVRKVIKETSKENEGKIYECDINENKIIWSEIYIENNDSKFRMTNYKYSDIYLYNIKNGNIEQLTKNSYYCDPSLYGDLATLVRIPLSLPEQNACNSEIIIMNLKTKEIKVVANETQPIRVELQDEIYRNKPIINEKYIIWNNSGFNNGYIYNYKEDKYEEIVKIDNMEKTKNTTIVTMIDNEIIVNIYNNEMKSNYYIIEMK